MTESHTKMGQFRFGNKSRFIVTDSVTVLCSSPSTVINELVFSVYFRGCAYKGCILALFLPLVNFHSLSKSPFMQYIRMKSCLKAWCTS